MTEDTLQINTLGLDRQMIKQRIDKANVASIEKQMNDFKELGRKIIACEMTMKIMGLNKEGLEWNGWTNGERWFYIQQARNANVTLFI